MAEFKAEINVINVEPVATYLERMSDLLEYTRQKSRKSELDKRMLEAYDDLMSEIESEED